MKNNVLITGCAGFIGSHLAEHYLLQGCTVFGVDNYSSSRPNNINYLKNKYPGNFHFFEADITQPWTWAEKISTADKESIRSIFHLASPASPDFYNKLPLQTLAANSIGLENALNFADAVGARLVFTSTSEVYGDTQQPLLQESFWGHVNSFGERACYTEAKRFGEALIFSRNAVNGKRHGLVRIFNTYGPRMNPQDGRVIVNFLTQALSNQPLTIYGDGKQTRSFCFISDLIDGLDRYAKADIFSPVNLGNDHEMTMLDLAQEVQSIFSDKKFSYEFLNLPKDDPRTRRPDLRLAKTLLAGWEPKVDLKTGLRTMLDWLQNEWPIDCNNLIELNPQLAARTRSKTLHTQDMSL